MRSLTWIRPGRSRGKIFRCPFCKADVSTPYKGVHDETELISGIPVRCRNNGKLNAHIEFGYMKGQEQPVENIKWVVENVYNHLWWTGYKWTDDINDAFTCELKWVADRYARFQKLEGYIITDHMFLPSNL